MKIGYHLLSWKGSLRFHFIKDNIGYINIEIL